MPELIQKSDDSQLHWFWKLTTKWWFFPLFYLFLAIFLVIIWKIKGSDKNFIPLFFGLIIMMPDGLLAILNLLRIIPKNVFFSSLGLFFPYIFNALSILSIIVIVYYKNKKNQILKWLLLTLLILLLLSFIGCAIGGPGPKGA